MIKPLFLLTCTVAFASFAAEEGWHEIDGANRFRVHEVKVKAREPAVVGGFSNVHPLEILVFQEPTPGGISERPAFEAEKPEIRLPDGQIILGRPGGSGSGTRDGWIWSLATFPFVPVRERELNVAFSVKGKPYDYRVANPAFRSDLPRWTPQPLPITWRDGDLEVTLRTIDVEWNEQTTYKGVRWIARPRWSVTLAGKPADKWFGVGYSIEDAGGNRSPFGGLFGEPAWKLHGKVGRSYEYPFKQDEVRWLGKVDFAHAQSLPPGNAEMFSIDPETQAQGLYFAGVFSPGEYELQEGKLVSSAPPREDLPQLVPSLRSTLDAASGLLHLSVGHTGFVRYVRRAFRRNESSFEIWLSESGKAMHLGGQGNEAGDGTVWHQGFDLFRKRAAGFQYGIARNDTRSFEMIVQPPSAPKSGGTKRTEP